MEKENLNEKEERGFFPGVAAEFRKRVESRAALAADAMIFLAALVFARTHLLFGAYPLATALVAVLPSRVFVALLGAAVGSLTLGRIGVIYAMISVIVVLLRVIISATDKERGGARGVFSESVLLRMCATVIGGFVGALYEILLSGFTPSSVLFGAATVILPPLLVFVFSGIFDTGITLSDFMVGRRNIFSIKKRGREAYELIFFQFSALALCFFISISLSEYSLFGISAAYTFSGLVTLFSAKRFGAVRGMAVGFVSSLGLSSIYSVAFALAGLVAGALFPLGALYASIGGALALGAWSAYSGGVSGFLTTLPEYALAAVSGFPVYMRLITERKPTEARDSAKDAADMVGTMALAYKNRERESLRAFESAISAVSTLVRALGEQDSSPTKDEYRDAFLDCADKFCKTCSSYRTCSAAGRPYIESADRIAERLCRGERITAEELGASPAPCRDREHLADATNHAAAMIEEEKFKTRKLAFAAEDYELISRLFGEARHNEERERELDTALGERAEAAFVASGFSDGIVRVFGGRTKHFIGAAEDRDGKRITAPEVKRALESATGLSLTDAQYFRRADTVLFECDSAPAFRVDFAFATAPRSENEVSGDTVRSFESRDGRFFALISDGMGSGEVAKQTSEFAAQFLVRILDTGVSESTAMYMLNQIIRRRTRECSATVDLFEFDLISGEGTFVKSGAATSYIKRRDSIFRIRSETAPLGLLRSVDAERLRAQVMPGDYVIMFSDGISSSPEDAAWLLELLAKPPKRNLSEYADFILHAAMARGRRRDDMTVALMRIMSV